MNKNWALSHESGTEFYFETEEEAEEERLSFYFEFQETADEEDELYGCNYEEFCNAWVITKN